MRGRSRGTRVLIGAFALGAVTLAAPVRPSEASRLGSVRAAALFSQNVASAAVIPRMLMADSFTSGTLTTGRVPESRQYLANTWVVPTANWSISSGYAQPQPGGVRLALYDTAHSNVLVSTTLIRQGVSNAGLVVRSNPTGTTYLLARFRNTTGGSAFLDAVVNGVSTNLASANNFGALATSSISVELSGPSVVVRYNGTAIINRLLSTAEQNTFGQLTLSGMWATNSTAEYFDDFFIAAWPPS